MDRAENRRMIRLLITFPLVISALLVQSSAQRMPKSYISYRATSTIKVDGVLDDSSWNIVNWTDAFIDIEGNRKPAPRFLTRVKMLWDDEYLYIGALLQEPHVWATILKRDSVILIDNDFEVFVDPDGDTHQYGELEMNAFNTVWDLFLPLPYRDGAHAVDSWDIAGLKTAVTVQGTLNNPNDIDSGWTVEIAMPWRALERIAHTQQPPKNGDQWRMNFSRVEWQHEVVDGKYRKKLGLPEDNWVWSPQGAINMHMPEKWGIVQFSTEPVGAAKFKPDSFSEAREAFHTIYYAQRSFYEKNKRWSSTLDSLDLADPFIEPLRKSIHIELNSEGYRISMVVVLPDGTTKRAHLRQDSLFWIE